MIFEGIPFFDLDGAEFLTTEQLLFLGGASGGKAVEDTATGNPVTFLTDLAKPLKSLVANFLPIQSSGTPSPDNILPITGWDAVNVHQSGINQWDEVWEKGIIYNGNDSASDQNIRSKNYIPVCPGKTYYLNYTIHGSGSNMQVFYYNRNKQYIGKEWKQRGTITIPNNAYYIRFYMDTQYGTQYANDISINYPATETGYHAFEGYGFIPATFPSTIYGGHVDLVTGEVWGTWKGVDLGAQNYTKRSENTNRQVWESFFRDAKFETYMSSAYQANAKCSEFDLTTSNGSWTVGKFAPALSGQSKVFIFVFPPNSFADGTECKTAMEGVQLVYELTTPVLITTLTPQQINAIKNQTNTVWSDANGDCEVTYLKKG